MNGIVGMTDLALGNGLVFGAARLTEYRETSTPDSLLIVYQRHPGLLRSKRALDLDMSSFTCGKGFRYS